MTMFEYERLPPREPYPVYIRLGPLTATAILIGYAVVFLVKAIVLAVLLAVTVIVAAVELVRWLLSRRS